jgi:excisionase family DNA binding protein
MTDHEAAIRAMTEALQRMINEATKQTYSLEEAAAYLKISEESVQYYCRRLRELSHVNLGGNLIFRKQDLDEFLERKMKKGLV